MPTQGSNPLMSET